jgi:hypothetical protein
MDGKKKVIEIHNHKNPLYRSVYADGVIGSITPSNKVSLNFYASRKIIPKAITYNLNDDGTLGSPIDVSEDSKKGIIREIEFNVYMDRKAATNLYLFLQKILEKDGK